MDRTEELIRRSQDGDKAARDTLIEENMGLIHHVAKRFLGRGVEAEDLFQIGAIGLLKAVDRFDLGSLLVQGENTIEIRLASTLINRVIAEHSRFSDFDHATYGITAAKIVPYALVG